MIIQLISQYLKTHRRLIIPGLGAFMVKDSEDVILFSTLLKRDDGVLRTLLKEQGLGDIEVAAAVDRFIFEIKHATETAGSEFVMKGFGVLRQEEGAKMVFISESEYGRRNKKAKEAASRAKKAEHLQTRTSTEGTRSPEGKVEPLETETKVKKNRVTPWSFFDLEDLTTSLRSTKTDEQDGSQVETTGEKPDERSGERSKHSKDRIKDLYSDSQIYTQRDSDIDDLTYTKRKKSLDAYTYVRKKSSKGIDKVLLFGIIAAIIAVGVIIYGYYVAHIDEITNMMIDLGIKSVE